MIEKINIKQISNYKQVITAVNFYKKYQKILNQNGNVNNVVPKIVSKKSIDSNQNNEINKYRWLPSSSQHDWGTRVSHWWKIHNTQNTKNKLLINDLKI